jgi:hypothetical protein
MKKTNKCELCGKRYKYPRVLKSKGALRENICFTCEVAKELVESVEQVLEVQYGKRYKYFLTRLSNWRIKKKKEILEKGFEAEVSYSDDLPLVQEGMSYKEEE